MIAPHATPPLARPPLGTIRRVQHGSRTAVLAALLANSAIAVATSACPAATAAVPTTTASHPG